MSWYFRVFCPVFQFSLLMLDCVYRYGMCIYNAVFGLVCCIPLYCCDTTPVSSTSFSINLTCKAACLCPFMGVLQRVFKVECCVIDTGGAQLTPLLQCRDSPWAQCTNRTPMNNCCCLLREEAWTLLTEWNLGIMYWNFYAHKPSETNTPEKGTKLSNKL